MPLPATVRYTPMTNMRFHVIALSSIIGLVVMVFAVSGKLSPKAPAQTQVEEEVYTPLGDKLVTVWEASWGLNCNDQFGGRRTFGSQNTQQRTTPAIPKNNVLEKVAELCNGKEICEFKANIETLGNVSSAMRCRPELDVMYRCFDFDRPWNVHFRHDNNVRIDCKNQ